MTEKPILFSGPMVRAILEGRKTQTRRVVKPQPTTHLGMNCERIGISSRGGKSMLDVAIGRDSYGLIGSMCPYGRNGDRLWVRETCTISQPYTDVLDNTRSVYYAADGVRHEGVKTTPAIHMPRWASRLTLEITGVRVERLQQITCVDCLAEGLTADDVPELKDWRDAYQLLWDKLNAKRGYGWDKNPFVWAIEFKQVGAPSE